MIKDEFADECTPEYLEMLAELYGFDYYGQNFQQFLLA